ncbi:MAG: carboxyl transferase [Lachnospiraceae bacterium]|nr:carboxyl transferase [Lachnospiraceae bacterium]MBQ3890391.1 carboxyl transferase [Lachnospiraceae bacterium]MCR4933018.1 carboxyl transferase [Lachnospiraceae bacterium]
MSTTSNAGQRILSLLDENSFVEIGAYVTARSTDFDLKQAETPSDGVITGYGLIDGNLVYVYSQDASVLNGTVGEMHAKKIANLYDLALKMGAPIIGLFDSAGLRLQESTDALDAMASIYAKQALASGVIPQISAIFGNCGGGLAIASACTDFTYMEEKNAKLFVSAPNALDGNYTAKCDTAAAKYVFEAGECDGIGEEAYILSQIRDLVSMLPKNNEVEAEEVETSDDLNRVCEGIDGCAGDTAIVASLVADDNNFVEVKAAYAQAVVTGFIRLNGNTVGVVANRTEMFGEDGKVEKKFDGVFCPECAQKAADFVNFCDAFSIPVLSFTNVTGFKATVDAEKKMAKAAAKLAYAFANATVPKVNVVIGKAYGSAYTIMNSKAIGCDITIAWPNAEIGTMDSKLAAKIMYSDSDVDTQNQKAEEYAKLQNNVVSAAKRGYVDQIVEPADTRKYVIGAFEMLYSKMEDRPAKKHGTI